MLSRWIWVLSLLRVITGLPASAETLTGQVVGVYDGNTLTGRVAGNRPVKVRLAGLDAPELDQTYGQKAKRALSALAFGKEARVESPESDKYGRTLGTVWVGAVNVNAELVKRGAACVPYARKMSILVSKHLRRFRSFAPTSNQLPGF